MTAENPPPDQREDDDESPGQPSVTVSLGKAKKKDVRALREGRGKLVLETQQAIAQVREGLGAEYADYEILPVVVIYKRKEKKLSFG
ncbi:MAG: hypothetical protein U1E65_30850 [Myxococcota bacterium]